MRGVKKLRCLFLKFIIHFRHNCYCVKRPALSKKFNIYPRDVILKQPFCVTVTINAIYINSTDRLALVFETRSLRYEIRPALLSFI